ncbi:MAG: EamA family transporter [Nitrospirae bacterium]|nr:EamA family transporter [Nitrospirota bacterium]
MENSWVFLSFISAFSLATSDALTKKALRLDNEYLVAWLRLVFSLPPLVLLLLFIPVPELDRTFYLSFFCALPLEILALILYIKALRISPMSLTLPFLSLTPIFLIVFSRVIVGESVSLKGAVGIILIATGGYSLNITSVRKGFFAPIKAIARERGSVYMIIVAMIYSITSSLGKLAIEHSSPLFFGATYFIVVTVCFTPLVYINFNKHPVGRVLRRQIGSVILPGLFYSAMIVSHMLAMSLARVAYMIAIKRSSLLIGSIYGFIFFREGNIRERLFGAALMFTGFVLIVAG